MKMIDLRSDTVTQPTEAMYEAMRTAPLGDDVLGDDPTVIKLEQISAQHLGKEAALLVPSGSMANMVSILAHCGRGEEVILGTDAHTFQYEAGGICAHGCVQPHLVPNQKDGTIKLEDIKAAIRPDKVHFPRTKLICLENTQNKCRGAVLTPDYMDAVGRLAQEHNLPVHVDGARIFNAAVALGIDVKELTRSCDTISFCLSKGLSCPVGSMVCGPADFIAETRRIRKSLGGGMRQAGVIAAAGIVALETMIDRLAEDHEHAGKLAKGMSDLPGIQVDLESAQTNMVYAVLTNDFLTDEAFLTACSQKGLSFLSTGPRTFRMVTHYGIESTDIGSALEILGEVLS